MDFEWSFAVRFGHKFAVKLSLEILLYTLSILLHYVVNGHYLVFVEHFILTKMMSESRCKGFCHESVFQWAVFLSWNQLFEFPLQFLGWILANGQREGHPACNRCSSYHDGCLSGDPAQEHL